MASTDDENAIIEKIDIGGISLIRAAAKNFKDVLVVPSQAYYAEFAGLLQEKQGFTNEEDRKRFATGAFEISSAYDMAIYNYFAGESPNSLKLNASGRQTLRYGENPHQNGGFYGNLEEVLVQLGGKAISYNNLIDIDAAVELMAEFKDDSPTFAVLKHTNPCGVATSETAISAWEKALAGDPVSAFGGIIVSNVPIDMETAQKIHGLFYEVLIAPDYHPQALELLKSKKKRILLQLKNWPVAGKKVRTVLNGLIVQDADEKTESPSDLTMVTDATPTMSEISDLLFGNKCVKHLKSNAIALVKDRQLIGMGCGQTSRVDALKQAILKAGHFNFDTAGAIMASDAFFPFPDCVEIAHDKGIRSVIQPGGSMRDQDSIDFCNTHGVSNGINRQSTFQALIFESNGRHRQYTYQIRRF